MAWQPSRDFEEIRQKAIDMQNRRSPLLQEMLRVKRMYDRDTIIPMPDLKDERDMPNLTPQLMTDIVDGLARRAASVRPMILSPSKDPYKREGPGSTSYARDRTRIINAVYGESGWVLARRRKARHENAYETSTIIVSPDFETMMPKLKVVDPLETYPEERAIESMRPPDYVAIITRYSGDYLRSRFPQVRSELGGPITNVDTALLWDVFEWYDTEQIRLGLLGPIDRSGDRYGNHVNDNFRQYTGPWMPLTDPVQNKAGVCLAYTPTGVTLHKIGNRLGRLIEGINWQNRLLALEVAAQEKAVFPDMFVLGDDRGGQPTLVDGTWKDGRSGEMNIISGASQVGHINQTPDPRTQQLIDRLENNTMRSGGLRPSMYGESHGAALRTGRALSQMAEESIDPLLQELHEMDEAWMPHVNEGILRCFQGWWPQKKYTMFSRWPGDTGELEFTPTETIEGVTHNTVKYAIAGADVVQLTQILGSMAGAGWLSTETVRLYHPYIDNPEEEQTKLEREQLDRALLEGMQQQVVSGALPVQVLARIRQKYSEGDKPLVDIIVEVDEEIREEQLEAQQMAAEQAAGAPPAQPGPNAVPGMAAGPGAAAPGALPPSPEGAPGAAAPQGGPNEQMRALLTAAMQGG